MEEISSAAGLSPRTFFNYFDSKDDAVLGIQEIELYEEVRTQFVAGGPTGRLMSDLETLVAGFLENAAPNIEQGERAMRLMATEPRLVQRHIAWHQRVVGELEQLLAERRKARPSPVDDDTIGMVAGLLMRASALAWARSGYEGDAAAHLPEAVAQLRLLLDD
ncbi:AcrR family transcriptional regulator [Nocardioides luteus]|uniref:TetR family transcriptional regulator n=1 Tax=Nocardioides luteus TaxID=1844 RepID=A0ABQ5SZC6_9ACTN|nr:TetR/AcrR family transcriptional regulator [Nocardioides luteus]MDR7312766.1 AcrR family transcriptional regulator [Nocardioides luteus]GGR47397.1 TetR family transcriptional regulator [Nocardioides luteus]GLJ69018.1 TetR family transcriptional regulator [Nocardioides luteus]